jgi:serpin B
MWTKVVVVAIVVTSIAGIGCAGQSARPSANKAQALVVQGNNAFAVALYRQLQNAPSNLFFSPYSISTALAMAYAGAEEATQEQMAQTLRYPTSAQALQKLGLTQASLDQEQFDKAFGQVIKDLNAQGARSKNELRVANALWGQRDYEFARAFVSTVERRYNGNFQEVDFITATENARAEINGWVEKQTNGRIKNLIEKGMLTSLTRLVLTNAIYFKGKWASPFQTDSTQEEPFTLPGGGKVQVPMMNQQGRFGYAQTDETQMLEMPYAGDKLSMVILLPKDTSGLRRLEQDLTAEKLAEWLGQIRRREVIVAMPKFKMVGKLDLVSTLQSMGMTDAFSRDKADFSGMTGKRELSISAVIHQAFVEVNEEGTEAAAATGIGMSATIAVPEPELTPVFRADHPFLFLIRDEASGSILFLGRVMSPES